MPDIVTESLRVVLVAVVGLILWRQAVKRDLLRQKGGRLILGGLTLLWLGTVLDLTDDFEHLSQFAVIGKTSAESLLEGINYTLGFILLAVGFWRRLPIAARAATDLDREKFQRALEKSEENYRDLFENASDLIQSLDETGKVNFVNRKWLDTMEYSKEEVEKLGLERIIHPSHIEPCRRAFTRILSGENINNFETVFITKAGRPVYVEGNINRRVDHAGRVSTRGIFRDITERRLREEELRQSESRYRSLIHQSPDPIFVSRMKDFSFTDVNGRACENYGYTREEFLKMDVFDIEMDNRLRDEARRIYSSFEIGAVLEMNGINRRKDGSTFPVHVRFARMDQEHVIAVVRDITEQKKAAASLARSEERFRMLVESAPYGIVVSTKDGKITLVNQHTEKIFGYRRQDLIGQSVEMLVPVRAPEKHRGHRREYAKNPKTQYNMGWNQAITGLHKNGREVPIEVSLSPLSYSEGDQILTMIYDITDRQKEQRILESKQREALRLKSLLEIVMHNMTAGLIVADRKGGIIMINRVGEEILGLKDRNIHGKILHQTYPELRIFGDEQSFSRAANEVHLRRKDGKTLPIGFSSSPFDFGEEGIGGVITVFKDLTEQLDEERKNREKEKLATVGGVAAGIAHEIKNPLFAISSGIQLLQHTLQAQGESRRTFEVIFQETMRVDRLIKQLLSYSGKRALRTSTVSLVELAREVLALNEGLLEEKKLKVHKRFSSDLPYARADRDLMTQVLINLVQNAIEVSPAAGRLEVSCRPGVERKSLRFRVGDQGPGVPDDLREMIFDPFFSTKRGSTGMGLAITKRIIADHGGQIWVEDKKSGGASFIFEIPLEPPAGEN